ncbi:MAG: VanW family protein [Coriobacteriales bacterium]|jgi:hypothetical protein|nr:VanW family protein [Coriobacteriales bacterium]
MAQRQQKYHHRKPAPWQSPLIIALLLACSLAPPVYLAIATNTPLVAEELPDSSSSASSDSDQQTDTSNEDDGEGGEDATESYEETVIGEYRAVSQGTDRARAQNIGLTAATIDGIKLEPQASFSFAETVGDPDENQNFQDAPAIPGDQAQLTRGGGISQVTSALYIAALTSGLTIDERHPHAVTVDYAPVGLDAAYVFGTADLRITNPYDYPVTIVADAVEQTVIVRIIGHPLQDGLYFEPVAKLVEYQTADGSSVDATGVDPALQEESYCVVESSRLHYLNGVLTRTELLSLDTYQVLEDSSVMATGGGVDPTK